MNIKFNSKYLKSLLCGCVFASASVAANTKYEEIKELNNAEFAQKEVEVQKKKSKLNKNNRQIFEALRINKYNIQILSRLMDNNSNFYNLYGTLDGIDNIYSAKFLEYELNNQKEINEVLGNFINLNVHKQINTHEDFEWKLQFLEYGLKNSKAGKNVYFSEIIKLAKNMDEALSMLNHVEKYGIMPKTREDFNKNYGKDKTNRMFEGIAEAKQKYNLNLKYLASYANSYKEPYYILKSQNALFRFDKKTGEIVTVEKENQIYNLKDNFVTSVTPIKVQNDERAFLDVEKLLSGEIETTTMDGRIINKHRFKQSKIKGEFEVTETAQNGKEYKIGLTEIDKKGGKHIEKHFTSQDGTVTDYVFADDKKGNRFLYYKITDKDKNVLYETTKKFKVLSKNHFQSSTNGVLYDIVFNDDKVVVTKGNQKVEYKIKEFTKQDYKNIEDIQYKYLKDENLKKKLKNGETTFGEIIQEKGIIDKYVIDKKLVKTLKNLSGEEWFALKNSKVYAINFSLKKYVAHSIGNQIEVGNANNMLATIEHELGHEKDNALDLKNDKTLRQIYEEEKMQFTTTMPDIGVKQAGYFLRNTMANGLGETCAEANLITNCAQEWEDVGSRTMFLQQNFPKTIAYIANRHNELC